MLDPMKHTFTELDFGTFYPEISYQSRADRKHDAGFTRSPRRRLQHRSLSCISRDKIKLIILATLALEFAVEREERIKEMDIGSRARRVVLVSQPQISYMSRA